MRRIAHRFSAFYNFKNGYPKMLSVLDDIVRQIDTIQTGVRCDCGGNVLPLLNLEAFLVARLAHRLGGGYYVHSAIVDLAASVDRS
jgi:hypothetical protein